MKEDFYISLLYKRLSKDILPDEDEKLEAWIQASAENSFLADSVTLAWEESDSLSAKPEVNLSEAFSELETRIREDEKSEVNKIAKPKIRSFQRNWMKIAAAITFLLAAALLLGDYFTPKTVEWVELRTTDEKKTVSLADNSVIQLKENSRISYPKSFTESTRTIKFEGEAFFDISPDPKHPFIIDAPQETIKVLGTSFRVKAFKDDSISLVQVATGKVSFRAKDGSQELILIKDEMGVLDKNTHKMEKTQEVDPNDMAWGTHVLDFKGSAIQDVLSQLGAYYQVNFEVENPALNTCKFHFTGKEDEPLENFLDAISSILGTEIIKVSAHTYQVKGGSCD